MSIIDDFEDIAMRMNRKEQRVETPSKSAEEAAIRTLQRLGYTYCDGAQMWKPPLGQAPSQVNDAAREALEERADREYREWMIAQRAKLLWSGAKAGSKTAAKAIPAHWYASGGF